MLKIIDLIIYRAERFKLTLLEFFFSLLSIIVFRTFLENLLEKRHKVLYEVSFYESLIDFFHITVSWITLYLLISIVIRKFIKKPIEKVFKITLFFFPVIIIVPLLDFTLFGSGTIHYMYSFDDFWYTFFNLFNPYADIKFITAGVRIEIFFILFFTAYYLRKRGFFSLFCALFSIYTIIYIYGYLPAFYTFFLYSYDQILHNAVLPPYSTITLNLFIYYPILLFLLFYFIKVYKDIFINFLRLERFSIYAGIYIFSIATTLIIDFIGIDVLNFYDLCKIFTGFLVLFFAFCFSTVLNDLYDKQIDSISNKNRPFASSLLEERDMYAFLFILLFLIFGYALSINRVIPVIVSFILALSYLYSAKPFRLRNFFILANILLGLIAVSVYFLGIAILEGNEFYQFVDKKVVYSLGSVFFFAASIKDIKDRRGDAFSGVITLTTLFGEKRSFDILKVAMVSVFQISAYTLDVEWPWQICIFFFSISFSLFCRNSERYLIAMQFIAILLYFSYILKLF